MKEKIMFVILGMIFLIGVVSAIYAGETITLENTLGTTNITYSVEGNSTPIELLIEATNEWINITLPFDVPPENITITLNGYLEETISVSSGGGGGSSHSHGEYQFGGVIGKKTTTSSSTNATNETSLIISQNETAEIKEEANEKRGMGFLIFFIIFLTALMILIIVIVRKKRKLKQEDFSRLQNENQLGEYHFQNQDFPK